MKNLWLDDLRPVPDGWIGFKTAPELISYLENCKFHCEFTISLDHDLGACGTCENESECEHCGTGYDVLKWIEEKTHEDYSYFPPKIFIRTDNSSAMQKMILAVESIRRIEERRSKR